MSQTVVPAGPNAAGRSGLPDSPGAVGAGQAAGLQSAPGPQSAGRGLLRLWFSGSPGRLRLISALTVLTAILVGLGGGFALRERSLAIDEAADTSAHLVLLQGIQTSLVQADAAATNSFLGFGPEARSPRLSYIDAIDTASREISLAAQAGPADAEAMAQANAALVRYTGYVSSARANNRAGNPVGANYLLTANALLQSDILPQLESRADAARETLAAAYDRSSRAGWLFALVVLVGIGGLFWAQLALARRSRRILNLPLVTVSAVLLVAFVVGAVAMTLAQTQAADVRDGALAEATALSTSRVEAFNAKSQESLTLIRIGSGTEADPAWTELMDAARAALPASQDAAAAALEEYATAHQAINDLDVAGDFDAAVTRALDAEEGSANAFFQQYADQTLTALNQQTDAVSSGLAEADSGLQPAGLLIVLAGLLAAVGAWWGVSLRLDEYR